MGYTSWITTDSFYILHTTGVHKHESINCLFLLFAFQYFLSHLLFSINCVTCSILASTGKAAGGGLGAWGYMAITLTLMGVGAGIYYFSLFYPILCKKERIYDVMELSSV